MTVIDSSILNNLRQRRSAGESLIKLALELGLPWQKLEKALRHGLKAPAEPPAPGAADPVEAAIREHQAMWARHPQWNVSTRPDDPPLRSVYDMADGSKATVVWVWRTADSKRADGVLHITLLDANGHQFGESGREAQRIAESIRAKGGIAPAPDLPPIEPTGSAPEAVKALLGQSLKVGPLTEKYRPRSLDALVGQDKVVKTLRTFVSDPYSTAFVFEGGTGTGKTSAALGLAAALGCDLSQQEMGGVYMIASGEQTADTVREINRQAWNTPFHGSGWKVVIVNEADRMNPAAETIWLDRLEQLPKKTVVVFTTNYADKLSQRFRDRCVRLRFESAAKRLVGDVRKMLCEMWRRETETDPDLDTVGKIIADATEEGQLSLRRAVQLLTVYLSTLEVKE